MSTELTTTTNAGGQIMQATSAEWSIDQVIAQLGKINRLVSEVLKEGIDEDFAIIPGTQKKTLLKPGAEKVNMLLRTRPEYVTITKDLPGGHREYVVSCNLVNINSEAIYGSGEATCSTMETKWRFRPGPGVDTGKSVPKEYWDNRGSDPKRAQESLGGKGFKAKKNDAGIWTIHEAGEVIENPNVADVYNTCHKIALKRAYVCATISTGAVSNQFTQDMEETIDAHAEPAPKPAPKANPAPATKAKATPKAAPPTEVVDDDIPMPPDPSEAVVDAKYIDLPDPRKPAHASASGPGEYILLKGKYATKKVKDVPTDDLKKSTQAGLRAWFTNNDPDGLRAIEAFLSTTDLPF